ncbi:hypothetical protein D3C76_1668480 [compost metagenome]
MRNGVASSSNSTSPFFTWLLLWTYTAETLPETRAETGVTTRITVESGVSGIQISATIK